ncbi:MAG: hypothetical protein KJ609_17850 [Gammaproteobacteria bacterium]|jgi:hypothetical protein|uniref:hypothetical protein n=1 Tax=Marinomonas polaris TaxID=293552 RepID=UPI001DCBAD5E|nr:hypothetical protein [Gammaproteobacteria bacterium]MBU1468322.1 hypothetical protein [Gammaproteobacteria bacterium]MBU2023494.1 hypothetical protein [Gammaproteobacteria bacterium]MBU2240544.1 hypothetical protein [Gammaproteobacteria bacterium]MBU2320416.1 hypothetical protein [Gammaproteobacteria bacterium]|tara:strand:- start:4640 stop:5335 length:696 start_codon:yes stop_codon:yes gene_type:complete
MKLSMLILVAVIFLAVLCLLPAFFRWRRHQRELKKKLLSRLSNRSDRLLYSLEMISDRYMARDTKIFLIEYLLSVITQLVTSNYKSEFVSKQADLLRLLTELKLGRQVTAKDRVVSQEQLDQIQNSLQFMLRELRSMGESYGASRVIIRHHIVLIRYAHALAYRDLLVRQARLDLDNDKKNRALEKYRIALSVMEKNASVSSSKREMARLQSMIQEVEKVLFSKNNKAELK